MDRAEYTVRESPRAKHVRLRVSLYDGSLTIVVPRGFDPREIPGIIQGKRTWIERARRRVAAQRQRADADSPGTLPARVHLRAVEEKWRLVYESQPHRSVRATEDGACLLLVRGRVHDKGLCGHVLGRWVASKARRHLVPWLAALSAQQALPVGRTIVRAQRTRWGSCSRRSTISLNKKLLFLPAPLVEYVMVHELCHTVHFNHSPEFWDLVRERTPEYQALEAELRTAWRYVPAWVGRNGEG